MSRTGVFITSMGIISSLGQGLNETVEALKKNQGGIKPLSLFPTGETPPLPAGEIDFFATTDEIPRTHALVIAAAREAMKGAEAPPDAIVIGVTTGGMSVSEELIKRGEIEARQYAYHSAGSVAEYLARHVGCRGPVLTVSTACSSGTVVLKIALELLRSGRAKQVLAGGADALCRLTYHGFHALQLVDEQGARPLDRYRRGMSVGEGAAMLLLTTADCPPANALAELLGVGLSCDAYHPASPHPEGLGALRAMEEALADGGISKAEVDYIHLHGTGTLDNDLAEAKALHALFRDRPLPPLSSLKGAFGHSLAGAGAMGAVVSVMSIDRHFIPANRGFQEPDPQLNLFPVMTPTTAEVKTVLANSFGFGGNNAVAAFGRPQRQRRTARPVGLSRPISFSLLSSACLTAAGSREKTREGVLRDGDVRGIVPSSAITEPLSEKAVRRMKRFSRMVLSLALSAYSEGAIDRPPASVYLGTTWGGLSETYDFLTKLFASGERFSSPTDFIGSVHNAAAGQVALHFRATGPNVTMTGSDCAFEQALFSASLLTRAGDAPLLVIGAEEYHANLSPLFDASVAMAGPPSDGGGALLLAPSPSACPGGICASFIAYAGGEGGGSVVPDLIAALGGKGRINRQFGALMAGLPAARRDEGQGQLDEFLALTGFSHPVIDYRRCVGEHGAASAVATVLAVSFVKAGAIPDAVCTGQMSPLAGRGVLVIGFGNQITALEVMP